MNRDAAMPPAHTFRPDLPAPIPGTNLEPGHPRDTTTAATIPASPGPRHQSDCVKFLARGLGRNPNQYISDARERAERQPAAERWEETELIGACQDVRDGWHAGEKHNGHQDA